MSPVEIVEAVLAAGGELLIKGDRIRYQIPEQAAPLLDELRRHKPDVLHLLRRNAFAHKVFPHCPKCASFALCRKNNIGNYHCLTCGLLDIPEEVARRLQ